jgi:carbamoylphosphate synthase large subunit
MLDHKILVTGIGGPAGKSAVYYLNENGFYTIGTDIADVSTPAGTFIIMPAADHPSYSSALFDIIGRERPSLFIPTVQEELPVVAYLKERIEAAGCSVFISSLAATMIAHNKLETARFMEGHGIPTPLTFDETVPKREIVHRLGIPLLSKPAVGRGGREVTVYRTGGEVYREKKKGLIFQEFIPGEEFDLNLFLDRGQKVLSSIVLKKTILKDGITGNAVAVERVENREISELGIKAAKCLKLKGPIDMDIRLRRDGTPVLLEINARLGGNSQIAHEVLDSLIRTWRETAGGAHAKITARRREQALATHQDNT